MSVPTETTDAPLPASAAMDDAPILYRARRGRLLFGVCAGTAAYVGWDVWLIRGLFVALTCIGGLGVLVYLGGALLVPLIPAAPAASPAVVSSIAGTPRTAYPVTHGERELE